MGKVTLKNISKIYENGKKAVDNISLEIEDKEFIVLVGPSGCGKTTTLRMIAGLEDISAGEIAIDGKVVNNVPPKERDIAMVFQNYALYPHMTVYENIAFGLKLRKFSKEEIDARVKEAAEILELDELLERRPKALSGGQRQRVAVGRAIVRKPKVFLFDEPLSNLDAKLRVQMRTEISKLHKKLGVTMIYVTHDQTEAMTMGDRIVLMKDGVIQQADKPMKLYEYPANKFVAGFIGSPAMNFIDGKISNQPDGCRFISEDGHFNIPFPAKEEGNYTLGVRPEEITFTEEGIPAELELIEPLGNESFCYLQAGKNKLIARIQGSEKIDRNIEVKLSFPEEKIHLFAK